MAQRKNTTVLAVVDSVGAALDVENPLYHTEALSLSWTKGPLAINALVWVMILVTQLGSEVRTFIHHQIFMVTLPAQPNQSTCNCCCLLSFLWSPGTWPFSIAIAANVLAKVAVAVTGHIVNTFCRRG